MSLDAFFEKGMEAYRPDLSGLHTKRDFSKKWSQILSDENAEQRIPETMIPMQCSLWFCWEATNHHYDEPGAKGGMKSAKLALAFWCFRAGRDDLRDRYRHEAETEYNSFSPPKRDCQCPAPLPPGEEKQVATVHKPKTQASESSSKSSSEEPMEISPLCAQGFPSSIDSI